MEAAAPPPAAAPDRIVAAARRAFASNGVRATRMAEVAETAGMARSSLYRAVAGRAELIELAAGARMRELAATVEDRVDPGAGSLASALTDCLATMIDVLRSDAEAAELIAAMDPAHAFSFMTGPTSAAQAPTLHILEPYYERAAGEGALRPGLTAEELAWWSRMFLAPLIARADLDAEQLRTLIRRFALPALIEET